MSKIKFYFILLIGVIAVISCNKSNDDDIVVEPPRDYTAQYTTESALIETYLKTNYITIVDAPGLPTDQNVTITPIPSGGSQPSIYSYLNSSTFPKLLSRVVKDDGITYTLYYLVLREGTGEKPCNVDDVFTSYNGKYLAETTVDNVKSITATQFEEVLFPQAYIGLYGVFVRGWKEIFPQFKSGDAVSNPDGTVKYTNFGAGVMFIPSGLAYYNTGNGTIPAYAPLVFSFKLYKIKRSDLEYKIVNGLRVSDPDGVPSYQEDIDGDGYVWETWELPRDAAGNLIDPNPDDTDGDGTPDFLDFDDDGDGYATRGEVKKADGTYYAFENIPDCDGNIPTDKKKKRHLDKECHKMSQ
ncbi:FKBP-type peptidyl-prolyl cis-trans isomerase [Flavobacterium sp. HJJ]|uniref:FKBP-type peptidyl-prolyl cis-trans isomerase n=1 Tax=Flavobacterium sp. HJJ TaxID=2783792 RepID=UPI00188D99D3|nr:FKBP-type peptidylprolyl isomerase [Flavobacterium sp. HJJ]MBF4473229.1 FKBP-type peptidylprolyl isomerase [Flavobacterium sp. HJJ]